MDGQITPPRLSFGFPGEGHDEMKPYEAIAQALVAEGADKMFGLMGDGNMWLWNVLLRDHGKRIYSARNEAAAVSMADGYSRTTGKVGIAFVTCGPGLTQCGTSIVVANRNRSQLVVVAGEAPKTNRFHTQALDQKRWAEANECLYFSITSHDTMAEEIAEAFYAVRTQRRPVLLNLPMDLQEQGSIDWDFEYRPSSTFIAPPNVEPNPVGLSQLADALAAAEKPVIIAGRGARLSGAREEIVKLGERTGALLATSLVGKGLFSGNEWDVGISGVFASVVTEELLGEADLILGIGAEVGYHTSEGGLMFPSAQIARIDIKPAPEAIGVVPGLHIQGDAKKAVTALNALLDQRGIKKTGFRTPHTKELLATPPIKRDTPNDGMDPRVLARELGKGMPKGALFTCGAGHFFSWPAMYAAIPDDVEIQFSYQFGAVGQGLPLAVGTGAGNEGRQHIVLEGDGSMMFNLQELDTVCREGLQMCLIVWNDAGYGAEVHKLKAKGFDVGTAQWPHTDFVSLAKAFGGDGELLDRETDLPAAMQRGLAKGGLYLIDARVSASTPTDGYAKVYFGTPNSAPLLRPVA